jgi:hypothetical protein
MRVPFAVLAFVCTAMPCLATDAPNGGASQPWIAGLADEPLTAVDDSAIELSPMEGRVVLTFTPRGGAVQKTDFVFLSDKIGTIADEDVGKVNGFFRTTDNGFEIQYDDGRTASLFANVDDGLTMTRRGSGGESVCVSWYPKNHAFSEAERRAAVAAYAQSLGINEQPAPAPAPKKKKQRVARAAPKASICSPAQHSPKQQPIEPRNAAVHPVESAPVQQAVVPPPPAPVAPAIVPAGKGASECLSVEVQGAYIGFHNRCGNEVQVAYCLQKASDPALACGTASKASAVAAGSFTGVFADSTAAEHDIRWVACSGAATDIAPELVRADPPAGRCVTKTP